MSWWGPHDVAGRAWIIVEATRAPDGLNDITGFDVRLASTSGWPTDARPGVWPRGNGVRLRQALPAAHAIVGW
jgi:hypothetical protein